MQKRVVLLFVISYLYSSLGLEYGRQQQRYNPNTDFLLHEGGVSPNGANKDQLNTQTSLTPTQQNGNQNNGKRDYVAQFPQLKPPTTTKPSTVGNNNQNSGKRDYVAPSQPTSPVTQKTSTTAFVSTSQSGGKRDYVAPQFPTLKPVATNQPTRGKVQDLINYYDRNSNQNGPQKVPSYSSVLAGSTNKNVPGSSTTSFTQTTPKPSSTATKPMSFSSVVSGSKGPSSPTTNPTSRPTTAFTQTTPKPSSTPTKPMSFSSVVSGSKGPSSPTVVPTSKPSTTLPSNSPTSRPGSPVLPSTIVNRNKNTQTNNNAATDLELQTLSEELLRKDVNNAAKYITVNYQEKTTSQSKDDKAPNPLLTVAPEAWNIPTIQKFVPLLDNYEKDTLINEYVTPQERNEENAFMDAIMSTSVIRHLMNFFKDKGIVTPDPRQQRDFLKQIWFTLYSRGKGKLSSSGFEHVFVSELKNGEIIGLHNWIYFAKEETANRINYLGYLKYLQLGEKGALLKLHFNSQGADKPVNSLLIGTSPELEIALYTLCFVTRADNDCKLKLANNDVDIVTHTFRYRSKNLIGSSYAQIPSNWS